MIGAILETKKREIEALRGLELPPRKKEIIHLEFGPGVNIIAELKRRSPSAGRIGDIDVQRIDTYSTYARGISVLTDSTYFGGSFELLDRVAAMTPLPVLCKDFILSKAQIDVAYSKGADLVLLIVHILHPRKFAELYDYARGLGLQCLVEVHSREDLDKIRWLQPDVLGVNARDLDTLRIDLNKAEELFARVRAPFRIAESGIGSRSDMERLRGANGFLIGEALMRSKDLHSTFRELLNGEDQVLRYDQQG